MRTETDLREAFAALADTAPATDLVAARLQYDRSRDHRGPRPRRTPRRLVLIAVAACLALIAALVPYVLHRQTAEPADLRAPGYWGYVSRLPAPTGWVIAQRGIEDGREYTLLGPDRERSRVCQVTVFGRGGYQGDQPIGTPVVVGDRAAVYTTGTDPQPSVLMWNYDADAWVIIGCDSTSAEDDRRWSAELLGLVRLTPTQARLPFRFSALPSGFHVLSLVETTDDAGAPVGGVMLGSDRGAVSVVNGGRATDPPGPGLPGPEALTVDGHPAEYRADRQSLTISVGQQVVGVYDGNRADLLAVADGLRYASDVGDRDTWFDARRALP